ncbi:UNKNOWN [Stylonychia lemnae]|uniref:Uncharacterized protein n=1 Tax=Stylonychia lemnae TaxID=5949 RepID=A0A077ZSJ1_STYLE|nr:UNKNOWN [Stylonychia lemnae]|eukprot:CDW72529.1 UNKNOWN [Stylonychia lemnae]
MEEASQQVKYKSEVLLYSQIVKKLISPANIKFQDDIIIITESTIEIMFPDYEVDISCQNKVDQGNEIQNIEELIEDSKYNGELKQNANGIEKVSAPYNLQLHSISKRNFSDLIRDVAIISDKNLQKHILLQTQNGQLTLLNQDLEIVKMIKMANNALQKSFQVKPCPLIEIQSLNNEFLLIQESDKKILIFDQVQFINQNQESEISPLFVYKEPNFNSIYQLKIIKDWRIGAEDLNGNGVQQSMIIATITLDPSNCQTIAQIQRLWLMEKNKSQQIQKIFKLESSIFNKQIELPAISSTNPIQNNATETIYQNFIKISEHIENPVLCFYTEKQIIFLDQRLLKMINYQYFESEDSQLNLQENQSLRSIHQQMKKYQKFVQHVEYLKQGTRILALTDTNEVFIFDFNESFSIDSICTQIIKDIRLPVSCSALLNLEEKYVVMFQQTGGNVEIFDLKEMQLIDQELFNNNQWTTETQKYLRNLAPILDYEIEKINSVDTKILVVAGFLPHNGIHELREVYKNYQILSKIEFEQMIDKIWLVQESEQNSFIYIKFLEIDELQQLDLVNKNLTSTSFNGLLDSQNIIDVLQTQELQYIIILTEPKIFTKCQQYSAIILFDQYSLQQTKLEVQLDFIIGKYQLIHQHETFRLIFQSVHQLVVYTFYICQDQIGKNIEYKQSCIDLRQEINLQQEEITCFLYLQSLNKYQVSVYDHIQKTSRILLVDEQSNDSGSVLILDMSNGEIIKNQKLFPDNTHFEIVKSRNLFYCLPDVILQDDQPENNLGMYLINEINFKPVFLGQTLFSPIYTSNQQDTQQMLTFELQNQMRQQCKQNFINKVTNKELLSNLMSKELYFPDMVTAVCMNYKDQNIALIASGYYLFIFNITRDEFSYIFTCLSYHRLRAQLRTVNWRWSDQSKNGQRLGLILIGDNEEGISVFTYNEKTKQLKLKAFDIERKQVIYSDFYRKIDDKKKQDSRIIAMDFEGNVNICNQIQSRNPLIRMNLETVERIKLNQMSRKFVQIDSDIYIAGIKGEVKKISIK